MGDDITIGVTEIVNNIEVTAQPNDQIVDISVIDNTDEVTLNITPTVIEINVNKGSSYAKWGTILGTLSDQEDLQDALDLKANLVDGKVPASELPSYVDDVIEVADYAALPTIGEIGKIYVTLDNNKIYRWSGSIYIEIAANNAIWGAITGTLSNQTDLQAALDTKALKTITITPNAPLSGGGDLSSNRTLSITQANTTTDGYLSSTDWNTFNSKLSSLSGAVLTTTDQTVAGVKKFTDGLTSDKAYNQKIISGTFMPDAGYGNFFQNDRQITFVQFNSAATAVTQFSFIYPASNTNQFYYLPDASGTLALISDAINNGVTTIAPSQNAVFDALALKQNLLTNPITGSLTTNYLPKATGSTTLGNSLIYDNGTNVGIGTTSPSSKLHITSDYTYSTSNPFLVVQRTGGAISSAIGLDDVNGRMYFGTTTNHKLSLRTNNTDVITLTETGNVGIGTTSPITKLHVDKTSQTIGGTTPNGGLVITNLSGSNYALEFGTDISLSPWIQSRNAASASYYSLLLNPSGGNVGIGTTSPTSKLQVVGLPSYADNTTALAGGLTVGAFYHTAGVLKVVI